MKFSKFLSVVLILVVLGGIGFYIHRVYERSGAKRPEVAVTIPEGSNVYDIDRILSENSVLAPGELISFGTSTLEGKLFPDTYYFYTSSTVDAVIQKFSDNFNAKAIPLFLANPEDKASLQDTERDLIIASLVQKEVTSSTDEAIVAGIIRKRLAANIPLDIDATICYIKQQKNPTSTAGCSPLSASDFRVKSPYNTYINRGLPWGPISNPGVAAIEAALNPTTSSYLYYLSDPKTGATIYAKTLAEQEANQRKYLN